MKLSLIVTTHERPDALAGVLATVLEQRRGPDELVIADDGSGEATRTAIEAHAARAMWPVRHVRQEHEGFRVARLRNLAIAAATGAYIVFVDGDMLLHPAFVADHRAAAKPRSWVQGVRIPLDERATQRLLAGASRAGATAPRPAARDARGLRRAWTLHAPRLGRATPRLGNTLVAVKSCNQGFWREDLVAANGFDERFVGWGPEDKELCARLDHAGIERRTLLFGAIAWHLHHGPAPRDRHGDNVARLRATLDTRRIRCDEGLDAHLGSPAGPVI